MGRVWAHVAAATCVAAAFACVCAAMSWGGVPREWTDVAQVQLWSGWQIACNLQRGLHPLLPTSLAWVDGLSVVDLVGNPGAAWMQVLASIALPPAEARQAAVLVLFLTNVAALAALGAGVTGARGAWLGAVAAVSLVPATWELSHGAWSAGWVAPGVASVVLLRARATRAALVVGTVGAVCAPVPTLAAAIAGFGLPPCPGTRPMTHGLVAVLALGVAWAAPPLGQSEGASVHPGQWVPFGMGGLASLPVLAWVALAGPGSGWRAAGALACALLALGPATVAGMEVRVPWSVARPGEWLVAAGLLCMLSLLARGPRGSAWLALFATALVDVGVQAARGVAVLPGQDHGPVALPEVLRAQGGAVLLLPMESAREGWVGWLPFAPVRLVGGPGLHRTSPARAAVQARLESAPATEPLVTLAGAPLDDNVPPPQFALRDAGVDSVLLLVDGGATEVAATRRLGVGVRGGGLMRWSLAAPRREAFAPVRGPR